MLIPVISAGEAVLVEVTLSEVGTSSIKLEDYLIDTDAVNALFDAFVAFTVLTGAKPSKVPYVSLSSAVDLEWRKMRIAGDSLGLGVLILLLQDAAGVEPNAGTVCAATGALDVRRDRVLCRQVGHLEAKLEGLEKAGVDILYCSAQGDAPVKSYRSVLVKQVSAITQRSNTPYFRMEFA